MDTLQTKKIVMIVVLVAMGTSFLTAMVVISSLTGEKPSQVVERIIEKASPPSERDISERILRQDELVVGVVKRASPAVVSIVATKDVPIIERYYIDPFGGDSFFQQFFGDGFSVPQYRQKGTEKRPVSSGTGFVVSPDGLIVTNRHVVADTAAEYTAFFNDGTKASAKVLARDPIQDIAIVKVGRSGLTPIPLGDANDAEVGQTVIAIGNALGEFSNTVSVGVVSGLHRSITASDKGGGSSEELQELIQTDAAINPGNSGGPLLNLRGEVIGLNVAMASGAENIGFAIPARFVRRDVTSVQATGRIVYPFLGVQYVMLTKDIQEREKLPVGEGAYITSSDTASAITKGSPAEKAGLREKDIITAFDGAPVDSDHLLADRIRERKPGDTVSLTIRRGGETLTLRAILEERK